MTQKEVKALSDPRMENLIPLVSNAVQVYSQLTWHRNPDSIGICSKNYPDVQIHIKLNPNRVEYVSGPEMLDCFELWRCYEDAALNTFISKICAKSPEWTIAQAVHEAMFLDITSRDFK